MNITVAGLGYVGLSLACLLSKHNDVVAIDINERRVADINNGVSPIKDAYIEAYLADRPATLHATTDSTTAYASADYVVIATPTNYDDVTHYFDTSSIESVLNLVQELNLRAVVVIKSTIPVGYTKDISAKYPQLQIIFSPEFLREGHALEDNLHPSRIVAGITKDADRKAAQTFVELLDEGSEDTGTEILVTGSTEAEAIKLFANTYLALRVSYFNELDTYAKSKGLNSGGASDGELLRELLLFWSAKEQKMVTLQEYVDKMPAEQKYIYFAAGDSSDRLAKLPSTELVLGKGYDVLLLTEDVDEFCLQILRTYPRKDAEGKDGTVEFKNVNSGDLGLETEEEKKAAEDATAENKDLFDAMKTALDGKVKEVKVSTRLKDHPVCLSADGPLSIEMEKVLSKQPGSEGVKSDKVLELNANHPVFAVLKAAQEAGDTDKINKYSALLYAQAQLIEGLPVDDPAAYAEAVCSLMK